MQRVSWVAAGGLLLLLLGAGVGMRMDAQREMEATLALVRLQQALHELQQQGLQPTALAALQKLPLRHMSLELFDAQGQQRLVVGRPAVTLPAWAHALWGRGVQHLDVGVPLPDGQRGVARFSTSPDSELLEAGGNVLGLLLILAGVVLLCTWVMRGVLARTLAPLAQLAHAIEGIERQQPQWLAQLPPMPVAEFELIAQALRQLVQAQEQAQSARRVLAHRLLCLQEDERQRVARDLHDETGQCLTALRVDVHWLQRQPHRSAQVEQVLQDVGAHVSALQTGVRHLLRRLRPQGMSVQGESPPAQTLGRLSQMVEQLLQGWRAAAHPERPQLHFELRAEDGLSTALLEVVLPGELLLGLYRITQEALTNVMRHAQAQQAWVHISHDPKRRQLRWRVVDDGLGLQGGLDAALCRGSGLAGVKERVWVLGGAFSADSGLQGRGLALQAWFALPAHSAAADEVQQGQPR
ncbi:sensor histidine kinase [Roseateles sp. BYS180W]|uniref:histidine kinase n=1 Tax=Roseateles rivi TaxID=3299028 RepID=A0ABW7FVF3_9BURK